jgi:hypothetical protein
MTAVTPVDCVAFWLMWLCTLTHCHRAGLNEHALNLLPGELLRLMCAAVVRGLKMLGDCAEWGTVMQAPIMCHALPRRMPPPAAIADVPMRAALLPSHLVKPASSDISDESSVFRWGHDANGYVLSYVAPHPRNAIAFSTASSLKAACDNIIARSIPQLTAVYSPAPFKRSLTKAPEKTAEGTRRQLCCRC